MISSDTESPRKIGLESDCTESFEGGFLNPNLEFKDRFAHIVPGDENHGLGPSDSDSWQNSTMETLLNGVNRRRSYFPESG